MNFKGLFIGIALIVLIGLGGFLYRGFKEQPMGPVACTTDAKICPDGTGLGRTGPSCSFPACPAPNVEFQDAGIAFALPAGYAETTPPDAATVAAYAKTDSTTGLQSYIYIRRFALGSTTPVDFIHTNAIMDASGMPASPAAFSSIVIGPVQNQHRFTLVNLGRFEGVVMTTYYLEYGGSVLRFDAQSRNVTNWTDPALDVATLPANQDLKALLATLQGN